MPWQAIWFEHEAAEGKARSPEWLRGLVEPRAYPYVHGFIESEQERLRSTRDPSTVLVAGERLRVFYSLAHDGGQSGLDQQGCRILSWLFESFAATSYAEGSAGGVGSLFSEIPVVIHEPHPVKAAALGNALTLLRFLSAREDQAIAKMALIPWNPLRGSPRLAAKAYEDRTLEFLHGDVLYPEDVDLFDVLERRDLRAHRELAPCCETQIGFLRSLLEWADDCWPQNPRERDDLRGRLRNSLLDEAKSWRERRRRERRAKGGSRRFV